MKNVDKIAEIIRENWPAAQVTVGGTCIEVNFRSNSSIKFNTRVEGEWIRIKFAHHWVKIPTNSSSRNYDYYINVFYKMVTDHRIKKEAKRTGVLEANRLKDMVSKNVRVSTSRGRVTFSVPTNQAEKVAKLLSTL